VFDDGRIEAKHASAGYDMPPFEAVANLLEDLKVRKGLEGVALC
jgi:hypothetical protein